MERIEAELFTDGGSDAVVRLPGRRFPGVLIQGDSLHILRSDVAELVKACDQGDLSDARESAGVLLAVLALIALVAATGRRTRTAGAPAEPGSGRSPAPSKS